MPKKSEEKKTKAKAVRVNHTEALDEVFFQNDDPYENFAVYTEPGKYKEGDTFEETPPQAVVQGNLGPAVG